MGNINLLAVLVGTAVFWLLGAVWYGPLFGRAWRRMNGINGRMVKDATRTTNPMWLIMLLSFAFEMVVVLMLGHLIARTNPAPHVIMMMATGLAVAVMTPALGINYLYQMRPGKLFAIDAGYFVVGMALVGGAFILLG
ncbi:DUF1761 domain-containing protein [Aurantiacibacter xanthus]|uniref:DUF1761 domain-containing protein n=1 Tax=Aurantiacibacter xanthus TaxID=1784712 RepID=A0A3A1NYM6_9SPHN|nr:DUF1761 domain-containing protein [Aurantiacibacter xanthus]RIV80476.1 DUF1761 domain-containing protein [Aurantiacibacter xanthus]